MKCKEIELRGGEKGYEQFIIKRHRLGNRCLEGNRTSFEERISGRREPDPESADHSRASLYLIVELGLYMLLRFQKAAARRNYETGNQAFSMHLRFLTMRDRSARQTRCGIAQQSELGLSKASHIIPVRKQGHDVQRASASMRR